MRRNWATVLLFVLALVVQTFAPAVGAVAGGSRGAAGAAFSAENCLTAGQLADDQKQVPGKASHHRDFCPFCQSVCDGVAPLAGRVAQFGVTPVAQRTLAWSIGARAPPVLHRDYARQARAPPAFS